MNRRGFTLLEVMISVGILSMVLVAVMATQAGALRLSGLHQHRTLAGELARAQLAEALVIPADEVGPDGGTGVGTYRHYRWERTLHRTATKDLTLLRISVRWGEGDAGKELVVETLITPTEVDL